jgi:single-strand DNA-binding protein
VRGFSKAIVAGNITRDPEMRTTGSGSQVCSFAIAVNRSFKDSSGNQQDQVSYLDCVAWGKSAEIICQYVHKGSALLVSGRLEQRSWEDKNSGQKRSRTEIVVEDFSFIGNNGGNGGGYNSNRGANNNSGTTETDMGSDIVPDDVPDDQINLDEIPF